ECYRSTSLGRPRNAAAPPPPTPVASPSRIHPVTGPAPRMPRPRSPAASRAPSPVAKLRTCSCKGFDAADAPDGFDDAAERVGALPSGLHRTAHIPPQRVPLVGRVARTRQVVLRPWGAVVPEEPAGQLPAGGDEPGDGVGALAGAAQN